MLSWHQDHLLTTLEFQTQANQNSLLSAYGSTFFLTLTNPLTILSFAAIFAGFGLANVEGVIPLLQLPY